MRLGRAARAVGWLLTLAVVGSGCLGATSPDVDLDEEFARPLALLSGAVFPDLVVEVNYERGHEPSPFVMSELLTALSNLTDKRSIRMIGPREFPPSTPANGNWSFGDLNDLARELYSVGPCCPLAVGEEGVLQITYVGGRYQNILGLHSGGRIWIFESQVETRGLLLPPLAELHERNIVLHEVGHALGLVDNPLEMQRPRLFIDKDKSHSSSPESIMYGGTHIRLENGTRDLPHEEWFDKDDLDDLRVFKETVAQLARADPEQLRSLADRARRH